MVVFWILRPMDIWTPGIVFPCTAGARVGEYYHLCIYIYMHHIYSHMCMNTHTHTLLAKLGFCSGGRISCKPKIGALLSTSIN